MAKKKQTYSDSFASTGIKDRFGTVFEGMAKNDRFKKLNPAVRMFYVLCRIESQTDKGKQCLYKHAKETGETYGANCFVFPASHQKEYGIKRQNGTAYFKALIEAGFIKVRENNSHRHKINVYCFSDKWKDSS